MAEILHYPVLRIVTPDDWKSSAMPDICRPVKQRRHYEALIFNGDFTPIRYGTFADEPIESLFEMLYNKQSEWNPSLTSEIRVVNDNEDYKKRFPATKNLGTITEADAEDISKFKLFIEEIKSGTYSSN